MTILMNGEKRVKANVDANTMNPAQTAPYLYCLQYKLPKYIHRGESIEPRLPNSLMLNIWLNMENSYLGKRIKNRGISCNSLWIPKFVL